MVRSKSGVVVFVLLVVGGWPQKNRNNSSPPGAVQAAKHNNNSQAPPPPPRRSNDYFVAADEQQQQTPDGRYGATPPPPPSLFDDETRYYNPLQAQQPDNNHYHHRRQDERRSVSSSTTFAKGGSTTSSVVASSSSRSIPIHYEFAAKSPPSPTNDDEFGMDDDDTVAAKASPRQDLMARYLMESSTNRLKVHASASLVGCMMGFFLAKSLLPFGTTLWSTLGASFCLSSSLFLRTPLGELVRALGLSLVLVLERTRAIRKRYPTYRYVASLLQFGSAASQRQRPFPPARNPWNYVPRRREDPEFNMMYSLIAMAFVGSACGGSVPLIPTWMGSLAGAASFGLVCLQNSPRGDLGRTLGMRVVALVQTLWGIQAQLGIIPKAAIVSSQIIDKCMVLDKQHKVKDRFLKVVNAGYHQVLASVGNAEDETAHDDSSVRRRRRDDNKSYDDDYDRDPSSEGGQPRPRTPNDDTLSRRRRQRPPPPYSPPRKGDREQGRTTHDNLNETDESSSSPQEQKKKRGWFRR